VYLAFLFNRNFIVKHLCEKKHIKNNDCQGNCHIKKELKKEAEKKSSAELYLFNKDKYESLLELLTVENSNIYFKKQYLFYFIKKTISNNMIPEIPPPKYSFCKLF